MAKASPVPAQNNPADQPVPTPVETAAQPATAVADNFDPLMSEAVIEKSYTNKGTSFTPAELAADIPEFIPEVPPPPRPGTASGPSIPQPGDSPYSGGGDDGMSGGDDSGSVPKKKKAFNPALEDLSDAEKMDKAKKMAEGIMKGYGLLNFQAEKLVKISEKKITRLQTKGEIDLSIQVPWEMTEYVGLGEFFKEFNSSCDGSFAVTQKFTDDVMPPLTRVLAKRGHGWSDEQQLIWLFGEDIFTKVLHFRELRSSLNTVIQFAKEQTALMRQHPQRPAAAAPPPPPSPGPAPAPASVPADDYAVTAAPEPEGQTLQQAALSKNLMKQGAINAKGMPVYGAAKKLQDLQYVATQQEKLEDAMDGNSKAKAILTRHKKTVKARPVLSTVPDGSKKKRGRPAGAKNKKQKW
jgi:hypothetical protein